VQSSAKPGETAPRPPDGNPISEGTDNQIDEELADIAEEIAGIVGPSSGS
jgi:hypothetical protein